MYNTTIRPFSLNCGRAGIRTLVPGLAEKPLSRRPQSSTLAPPQFRNTLVNQVVKGGGRGIRTPGERVTPTTLFKSAAINHSAIPPLGLPYTEWLVTHPESSLTACAAVYHSGCEGSTAHYCWECHLPRPSIPSPISERGSQRSEQDNSQISLHFRQSAIAAAADVGYSAGTTASSLSARAWRM